MIKKLSVLLLLVGTMLAPAKVFGDAGIFGTDIGLKSNLFNSGGNTFFEADLLGDGRHAPIASGSVTLPVTLNTTGFNGLNLGNFNPGAGDTLILIGGEALTFKNTGTDVTGTFINWSIDGGGFTGFSLGFNEDNVNAAGGDQRWASTDGNINLLTGLGLGQHTLTFFASGATTNPDGEIFDSNNGANFTATFTVVPEPSTVSLLAISAIAGSSWLIRRRRA